MKLLLCAAAIAATACTLPPATTAPTTPGAPGATATTAGGTLDLVYQVPDGWSEQRGEVATLSYQYEDMYDKKSFTLVILPSRPVQGSLGETYQALWAEQILPLFTPGFEPAPFRRRLASGYPLWFDGDDMVASSGATFQVILYMVVAGDRVVPLVGLYLGLDQKVEIPIAAFFDALSVSGAAPTSDPLFDAAELAGDWSEHSASYADYVDSSGNYRGDATVATGEEFHLDAGGSYESWFTAVGNGSASQTKAAGAWSVADDFLVLDGPDEHRRIRIFAAGTSPRGGRAIYLPPNYDAEATPDFTMPRRPISGGWYGRL